MADFSTAVELSIILPDSEIRSARSKLEDGLSDVPVGINGSGGAASRAVRSDGGAASGMTGRRGRRMYRMARERTALLETSTQLLEQIEDKVGGGGGGLSGGLIGGTIGRIGIGSALAGAAGGISASALIGSKAKIAAGALIAGKATIDAADMISNPASVEAADLVELGATIGAGALIASGATVTAGLLVASAATISAGVLIQNRADVTAAALIGGTATIAAGSLIGSAAVVTAGSLVASAAVIKASDLIGRAFMEQFGTDEEFGNRQLTGEERTPPNLSREARRQMRENQRETGAYAELYDDESIPASARNQGDVPQAVEQNLSLNSSVEVTVNSQTDPEDFRQIAEEEASNMERRLERRFRNATNNRGPGR